MFSLMYGEVFFNTKNIKKNLITVNNVNNHV